MSEIDAAGAAQAEPVVNEGAKASDEPLGEGGLKALKAEREARSAAERNAADLAARVKQFEDEKKSAEELAGERLAEAERRAVELEQKATRAEVAASSGVPVEILSGPKSFAAADLSDYAESLTKWRGEGGNRLIVRAEGATPANGVSSEAEFARSLFGSN